MSDQCKRFGKRFIPWKMCDECPIIEECSRETMIWFAARLKRRPVVVS